MYIQNKCRALHAHALRGRFSLKLDHSQSQEGLNALSRCNLLHMQLDHICCAPIIENVNIKFLYIRAHNIIIDIAQYNTS